MYWVSSSRRNREVLIRAGDGLDHEHRSGDDTGRPEMIGGELQNLVWLAREGERRGDGTSNVGDIAGDALGRPWGWRWLRYGSEVMTATLVVQ
ncbi:hypothetical protein DEO72_LG5g1492 [Vigna unguiculata]|uniref:Uncharacterized protein n=1 Tax=Vigna unguiculata TaxID=3917 RepID=A0A4D6LXK1_VIGUN|nr:hypothetical protein DEO72_LG5g1492 [Vigna unguiculata]